MANEGNDLQITSPKHAQHITLNIFDIISFLGTVKLEYLGDEVSTEIIVCYNEDIEIQYHIDATMSGKEIREIFNKLPNEDKKHLSTKIILTDELSKKLVLKIIENSKDQYYHYVQDAEIKGSIINAGSIIIIVSCIILFYTYYVSSSLRAEIGGTISEAVIQAISEYVNSILP